MNAKALIVFFFGIFAMGCASSPTSPKPVAELRLVDQRQIRNVTGESRSLDAFSPKASLIFGMHEKFYCLSVETNLLHPEKVELTAEITDASGSPISTLLLRDGLKAYWQKYEGGFEERFASLAATIDRYAMPSEARDWRGGNTQYYAVLSISADAKPSRINAELRVDGVIEAQLGQDLASFTK